jgi:hypothetical protein
MQSLNVACQLLPQLRPRGEQFASSSVSGSVTCCIRFNGVVLVETSLDLRQCNGDLRCRAIRAVL